jgi:hypothetical protein
MRGLAFLLIFVAFVFFFSGLDDKYSIIPNTFAETNSNLYVSSENVLFENHFVGPMVIEVKISDSDIDNLLLNSTEPIVKINNNILRMAQAVDGNWYGYFGDKSQIMLADSLVGLPGYGLDFGEFCLNTSAITGTHSIQSSGIVIPRDILSASNGNEPVGLCNNGISSSDSITNNVLRDTPSLNTQSTFVGQIDVDSNSWPFIQLYDFVLGSTVNVKYDKEDQEQTVDLIFDENDDIIKLESSIDEYRSGIDVKLIITDPFLNIDPTEIDSWTWAAVTDKIFYRTFGQDGGKHADGTVGNVDISNPSLMWFNQYGQFSINPNIQNYDSDILVLQDNDNTILVDADGSAYTPFDLGTESISPPQYPITFTETSRNSGIFVNFDSNGKSNLRVNDNIPNLKSASFEYSGISHNILVQSGTPPTAVDDVISIIKDSTVIIDVLTNDIDVQNNPLTVSLLPSSIEGIVIANDNGTITYIPDTGFIGTEIFDYLIDDFYDGTDTGTVKVNVNPVVNTGSIDQIIISTDKSSYLFDELIDFSWNVPSDSAGSESILKITFPTVYSPISENATVNSIITINTENFEHDGEYTARVEHGQYYGLVEFTVESESTAVITSEQSTSAITASPQIISAVAPSTVESVNMSESVVIPEKSLESAISLASFIDPQYAPSYYLERYASEPSYKKWFDDNYAITIESAVGYSETSLSDFPNPTIPRFYYVERYNNEPSYRTWFDNSFPNDTFEGIIGIDSSLGFSASKLSCSDGKQLVFKTKDMSTVCASPTSVEKLLSKGWATSFVSGN